MVTTVRFALSLLMVAASTFLFGDGLRLIAEWRVGGLIGIFMLAAGLLGAVVFAYRAQEVKCAWPISITKAP